MDQFTGSALDESCVTDKDDKGAFKSKNLLAERRRRRKLNDGLLALRAMVPHITNMKKETIIDDAITYIKKLQQTVDVFKDQLLDMEASSGEATEPKKEQIHDAEDIKLELGIQPDITVNRIYDNKLWIKVIFEKKQGGFTKLMEAVSALGFELTDTSLTTFNGAMLVTSCLQGFSQRFSCETLSVQEFKELLLGILKD